MAVEPRHRRCRRRPGCSTPAAASWRRASSICTPTCASRAARRPRRSRPGSRAAALGGYGHVVAMPNTEPAIDSRRGGRARSLDAGQPARAVRGARRPRRSPSAAAGEQLAPDGRAGRRPGQYASSPTTAPACRTTGSCAGPWSTRRRVGRRRDRAGAALRDRPPRRRRPHARGRVVGQARPARHPRRGRGADGRPRPRAGPAHRRPHPLPAPVDGRVGRAGAGGQGGRPATSPPRPPPTTSRSPTPSWSSYDPVFKVNPPLRTDDDVAAIKAGLADGTIDAIATDHAPHTQDAKELPFDQAPPGMLGLETALALALTELDLPDRADPGPACRGSRRRSPGSAPTPVAESSPTVRPANLCVFDPDRDVDGRPRQAGQPQPQHAVRRTHAAGQGPPHDRRFRGRSCSTARPSDERTARSPRPTSCWPTARPSRARPSAPPADGGDRRGRVQHRAHRLPGGDHRSVVRRADHHLHLSRTSATTASRRPTTRAPVRSAEG